ncbi:MAG: ABC transporter ATP-binding protein [Synechococcales bacterium]|nr:ABC transporter ATP-binding protein [Synechococcales bacterium]
MDIVEGDRPSSGGIAPHPTAMKRITQRLTGFFPAGQPSSLPAANLMGYRSDRPLQTLFHLYRRDAHALGLSFLFYLVKHSPEWIRPLIIANIVDIIAAPAEHGAAELWWNAAVLAVLIVQNVPTHYLHIGFMSAATRRMEFTLRSAMTERLQQLSIGFYHSNSKGALQSKITRDVESIQLLTDHVFQLMPAALMTILVAIAVTAARAPWFLLFFLGTVPVAALLVVTLRGPIRDRNQAFRQQMETMAARLVEMIQLVPVTRAHGAEQTEIRRVNHQLNAVQQTARRLDAINAIAGASSWVTLRLFNGTCLVMSAWFAYTGQFDITAGDVVLLTTYFDTLTTSVVQLMMVLPQIGKGFDAIRSISEILECPDLEQNVGKRPLEKVIGAFEFEKVGFQYPGTSFTALYDMSLAVAPGETVAIVGPSGAGKSTFLNLVIGFLRPTSGRIWLDGQDMADLDLRTYRQYLSVVSQDTILFQGTVRENVTYGVEAVDDRRLWEAIHNANAGEFVENLPDKLDTRIGEDGMKLSGGQRQRLAIARALIRNPRVLVLDEATSALDSATELQIQEALERLMQNRTTFVVAHRLSTVRHADRILVMDQGRIVEMGTHGELLRAQGTYAGLHRLQA